MKNRVRVVYGKSNRVNKKRVPFTCATQNTIHECMSLESENFLPCGEWWTPSVSTQPHTPNTVSLSSCFPFYLRRILQCTKLTGLPDLEPKSKLIETVCTLGNEEITQVLKEVKILPPSVQNIHVTQPFPCIHVHSDEPEIGILMVFHNSLTNMSHNHFKFPNRTYF